MPADPFGVVWGLLMILAGAVTLWRPEDVVAMNRMVLPGKVFGRDIPAQSKEWGRVGGILGMIWGFAWLALCWFG